MTERRAFIEVNEDTLVRCIWHVELEGRDVLGWMIRQPGEDWDIGYRWRHYADQRVWGSDDRKSGYRVRRTTSTEPTEAELVELAEAFNQTFELLCWFERALGRRARWERVDINKVGPLATAELLARPWAHVFMAGQTSANAPRGES